jgi:hypothetical protein
LGKLILNNKTMDKAEYITVMWAEQKPNCYGGKEFNEHIPMWDAYFEGDKDSEHSEDNLILDPKLFPAGTKIIIQEPICPKCEMSASLCIEIGECDFDWKEWAEDKYS